VLRAAYSPFHGPDYDVHLGATLQGVLDPADTTAGPVKTQAIRLQERPESRVTGVRLVDTGALVANGVTVYGLETGASWGPLYAVGEWFKLDVDRTAVGTAASPFNPSFSGWYAQGSYALTGERHVWSSASGGFRGLKPSRPLDFANGAYGAIEVAARFSRLDLNDRAGSFGAATPVGGVRGGTQDITSLGLNWYPNNTVRFLL
ncbi:porin, partial [Mycobacterium tuberculosis]